MLPSFLSPSILQSSSLSIFPPSLHFIHCQPICIFFKFWGLMWRPWAKSSGQTQNSTTTSNFSCSTFKDIQHLCTPDPTPHTPNKPSVFHRARAATSILGSWTHPTHPDDAPEHSDQPISIPGADKRIVVYFTSLRVVRSTFEACRSVRSILRGFRVSIDERDLSMDSGFLEELQGILGHRKLTLPRVFIGGRYIGGADEIRQLHETGELKKFVEGLPPAAAGVCEVCGGYGFSLCGECSGSHRCYSEKSGFRSCLACNENGLIRCPSCSCAPI